MARHTDIEGPEAPRGVVARAFGSVVAGPLAVPIILAWIAVAVLAVLYLPSVNSGGGSLSSLLPANAPAIAAERHAVALFGVPVLSRVMVVQRDAAGLSPATQQATVAAAVAVDRGIGPRPPHLLGAFPLVNDARLVPKAHEHGTTAITYLFFDPALNEATQVRAADAYATRLLHGASVVGVTGAVPGRLAQEDAIAARLNLVEIATVVAVALVVALALGSLIAPLLTLFVGAIAYETATHVVGWAGQRYGFAPPPELDPLIVVLLLGVVTDYVIFFFFGFRTRLRTGESRSAAARHATAQFAPIVLTAGLTVAAGTLALVVARQTFFRDFGPGLALTVVIGMVVALTLVPALLAVVGRGIFWPRRVRASEEPVLQPPPAEKPPGQRTLRERLAHVTTSRAAALSLVVVCVALLLAGASGLRFISLGLDFITGLPAHDQVRRAAEAASAGFAPGIVDPTQVVVQGPGVAAKTAQLSALEQGIASQAGVAGVVGPREQAVVPQLPLALSRNGDAARYLVVFNADPLGGAGIAAYDQLRGAMPGLLQRAGLGQAQVAYSGDTALAQYVVGRTVGDLALVGITVCVLDAILLAIFLRALFAPLYLVAASVLALAAALGLTTYLFVLVLGGEDLTYYVPFAASVLLISLGSDYNIYLVGRIWDERRRRPLRGAIETAVPRARRAITSAALALAVSFAMLAFVDLAPFRQLAFLLAAGVLIDSFFVRSVFVPALVALFGRRHIEDPQAGSPAQEPDLEQRAA